MYSLGVVGFVAGRGKTKLRCALIGEKLGHSYSPAIHRWIWEELGLAGDYDLLEIPSEQLKKELPVLAREYDGLNVTLPYKETLCGEVYLMGEGREIGSVNTLEINEGNFWGWNTDYFGFKEMLQRFGVKTVGRRAVVLGSGGTAKMVCQYLSVTRAEKIILVSRRPKDLRVWSKFASWAKRMEFSSYGSLEEGREEDLLINCTPVGMFPQGEECPVSKAVAERFKTVVDLVYNPHPTLLVQRALGAGHQATDGLYMLVAQAVGSEQIWLQRSLPRSLIKTVYEKLLAALK